MVIEEGKPLTFVADFETMPEIDLGEYKGISLRKPPAVLEVGAVDRALEELRERAARWKPVEDRPAEAGDTVLVDLTRKKRGRLIQLAGEATPPARSRGRSRTASERRHRGRQQREPGRVQRAAHRRADWRAHARSRSTTPRSTSVPELAGATVDYDLTVKGIRRKELLPIDDDFAKEVSDAETLEELRTRIQEDLQKGAEHDAEHKVRHDLLTELSSRIKATPEVAG